jgi:hypothetical protein
VHPRLRQGRGHGRQPVRRGRGRQDRPGVGQVQGQDHAGDINPPNSYTITFDGQGGAAGFGKGSAQVSADAVATKAGCELSYTVHASVGGKIAQLGQRLIDGVAKSMAEDFFKRFDEEMQRQHPDPPMPPRRRLGAAGEPGTGRPKCPVWAWAIPAPWWRWPPSGCCADAAASSEGAPPWKTWT